MTRICLTLRVNRRAIGAVALDDELLKLADGRHLSSRQDKTVATAERFVRQLLDLIKPALLIVDVPARAAGRTTDAIIGTLEVLAAARGIEILPVSKAELLTAYGLTSLRNRQALRAVVRPFWPELARIRGKVEPYVVDAAAAALYAECRIGLERIPA